MRYAVPAVLQICIFLITCTYSQNMNGFLDLKGLNSGQTVCTFLTLPVSASVLGQNFSAAPYSMDATDIAYAPASTAFFRQNQFAITHLEWLMGLRKEYTGASFPFLHTGTFSLFSQIFTPGSFEYARDIDEYESDPSVIEMEIGASYARKLFLQKLSAGITMSFIESHLDGEIGRAFRCGTDLLYRPFEFLSTHYSVQNIGTDIKYTAVSEPLPLQIGVSARFTPLKIPRIQSDKCDVAVSLGARKTIDTPLELGIGIDVTPFSPLSIHSGYEHFYGHNFSIGGLSGGIGLDIKQYGIDAGWKYQSPEFGSVWAVTVRYRSEEKLPQSAIEYYRIAELYYSRNRFRQCIRYARRALNLNPNMWKAHSLIAQAIAQMHQKRGTEIALLYTGNIQGHFTPFSLNGTAMGGIARHVTILKNLQEKYRSTVSLFTGNMIAQNSSAIKAQFADVYYDIVDFDAIGCGIAEAEFLNRGHSEESMNMSAEFICTNCARKMSSKIVDSKIITPGRYKIAVISVVPLSHSNREETERTQAAATYELLRYTQSNQISQCHYRILIVNDSWEMVQHYAMNVPLVDLVICGALPQHFNTPMKINNTPIVSCGEWGKYIGVFTVRFNKDKKVLSYNNTLVPVTYDVPADPEVDIMVQKISMKAELQKHGITAPSLKKSASNGVFLFLSDRNKIPHIYMKVIHKNAEFPLTFGDSICARPDISFKNNMILYLTRKDKNTSPLLMSMDLTGTQKRQIMFGGAVQEACFNPQQTWIYASVARHSAEDYDICRIKPQGGEVYPVIEWNDGAEKDITFSHDAMNMLFTSDRDAVRHVYICNSNGQTVVQLTDDNAHHTQPQFSPLDKYVSWLSNKNNFHDNLDLWIYDQGNGTQMQITRNANVRSYCWLDDKGTILYEAGVNVTDLNIINIFSGDNKKLIPADTLKDYSESNPRCITFNNQKKILYIRTYKNGIKKIHWVNIDGSGDQQIVSSNGNSWIE